MGVRVSRFLRQLQELRLPMRKAMRTASVPHSGTSATLEERATAVAEKRPTPKAVRLVERGSCCALGWCSA